MELKLFQKKEKKARWYQEKKRRLSDGSAENPRKSSGSGGLFSDSDTPLESPSSVATDATIILSDSGSEMELGHPFCSSVSASGASTDDVVTVVDSDHSNAASSPSATATTPSTQQTSRRSCSLTPMSLFPVPKLKSSSKRRRCSSSAVSPTSAPSSSSSALFSPPLISAQGRSPLFTLPKSGSSSRGRSPTFVPAPTRSRSSTPEASRSPSPLPGPIRSPVPVPPRSGQSHSPATSEACSPSPVPSEAHSVSTHSTREDQQVFFPGPSCTKQFSAGRPLSTLVELLAGNNSQSLSYFEQVSSDVSVSRVSNLSLAEYVLALPAYCVAKHREGCSECSSLLQVAKTILENGFVKLSDAHRSAFPSVSYHSHSAKRKFLKMPLAALRVGLPKSGYAEVFLFERFAGVNYHQFLQLLNRFHSENHATKVALSKDMLRDLLQLACSDRERECIRYTAWKASGLSASAGRKQFGLDNMSKRANHVEQCIEEVRAIRESVERVCHLQEQSVLASMGIALEDWSSDGMSDDSGASLSSESDAAEEEYVCMVLPDDVQLLEVLQQSAFNWFEFVSRIEDSLGQVELALLEKKYEVLSNHLAQKEKDLMAQSHDAFIHVLNNDIPLQQRQLAVCNGLIVSESESEDPDDYARTEQMNVLVQRRLSAIKRRARRNRAKLIAERNFLLWKSEVLEQMPGGELVSLLLTAIRQCNKR